MQIWEHLFLTGEFREREDLLSGLTLEQVTMRPDGVPHSIYDELWHAATWQRIVVERDQAARDALLDGGEDYPRTPPEHEQQWHDVVRLFLDGARAAAAWARSGKSLLDEERPGVTGADTLSSLAVHNAYHLGKIVALRQRIGAWPPKAAAGEA
ncbi:MAG: DinB family protein [Acidobacteria bacterium]|nr:DinB family protein [Acidobacteriota bacterium]